MSEENIVDTRSGSWHLPATIILGLIAIGGLGFGWHANSQLDATQQTVAAQVRAVQQSPDQDMAGVKDRQAQAGKNNSQLPRDLNVVTNTLKNTPGPLK